MDPDTYPRPNASYILPFYKDKECMNYYRRPKSMCLPLMDRAFDGRLLRIAVKFLLYIIYKKLITRRC